MTKVYIASNNIHVEIIRFRTIATLVTFETRQQRAHCYPRRVATVISRQHFATILLARWQLTTHRHAPLELQVVSTGDMKGGSRPHPSHSTKGKTIRAHCQYTSDRQYNYNNKYTHSTINTFISRFSASFSIIAHCYTTQTVPSNGVRLMCGVRLMIN